MGERKTGKDSTQKLLKTPQKENIAPQQSLRKIGIPANYDGLSREDKEEYEKLVDLKLLILQQIDQLKEEKDNILAVNQMLIGKISWINSSMEGGFRSVMIGSV